MPTRTYRVQVNYSGSHTMFVEAESVDDATAIADEMMWEVDCDYGDEHREVSDIDVEDPYRLKTLAVSPEGGHLYVVGIENSTHLQAIAQSVKATLIVENQDLGLAADDIVITESINKPEIAYNAICVYEDDNGLIYLSAHSSPPTWARTIPCSMFEIKLTEIRPTNEV